MPAERVNDDRLFRALDRLLPHKQALETHLKERLGALFDLDYELLLYDVTSTYFEGQAEGNGLARRGYSRDHRGDCKQVCIGLVVTRDGVPLGYEVFAGNRTDVTTVEEIVTTMERRYGQARRVWVMDRGMASAENIAWLRGSQRLYLIGASKSELKKFAGELADRRDWQQVRDGVEAKVCAGPDGSETFLLGRSAERQQKEQAMHDARFSGRIETALAGLQQRIERARKPIDHGAAERQIGRLLGRNSRAAARYAIRLVDDQILPAGLRLEWSRRAEWDDWSRHSEGCYVLRTNLPDWMGASVRRLRQAGKRHRRHPQPDRLHDDHPNEEEPLEADALVCVGHTLHRNQQQRGALQQRGPPDHRDDDRQRAAAPDIVAKHDRQAGGSGDHAGEQHPRPAARHLVERRQGSVRIGEHADRDRDEVEPEQSSKENGCGHAGLLGAR